MKKHPDTLASTQGVKHTPKRWTTVLISLIITILLVLIKTLIPNKN